MSWEEDERRVAEIFGVKEGNASRCVQENVENITPT